MILENAIKAVCHVYKVKEKELLGRERTKDVADARHMLIYVMSTYPGLRMCHREIAEFIQRDRSSVTTTIGKISNWTVLYRDVSDKRDEVIRKLDRYNRLL